MQAPLALTPEVVALTAIVGAVAGLAGDGRDLDGAVGDLRDLEGEELLDQRRVAARQRDLRARMPLRTLITRHLMRVPCSYFSPGTAR